MFVPVCVFFLINLFTRNSIAGRYKAEMKLMVGKKNVQFKSIGQRKNRKITQKGNSGFPI